MCINNYLDAMFQKLGVCALCKKTTLVFLAFNLALKMHARSVSWHEYNQILKLGVLIVSCGHAVRHRAGACGGLGWTGGLGSGGGGGGGTGAGEILTPPVAPLPLSTLTPTSPPPCTLDPCGTWKVANCWPKKSVWQKKLAKQHKWNQVLEFTKSEFVGDLCCPELHQSVF